LLFGLCSLLLILIFADLVLRVLPYTFATDGTTYSFSTHGVID